MDERAVFFLSDQTGVTAETLGHSLLTQFDGQNFRQVTLPFIDNEDKAREAVQKINESTRRWSPKPIIFSTLVQDEFRAIVRQARGLHLDIFDVFLEPLEAEFGEKSTQTAGRAHGMSDIEGYMKRIEATNFALANDDGGVTRNYEVADVILVGVSRSGKTPTCLYLALQYGVYAANYPLTEEELDKGSLARILLKQRDKAFRADNCARPAATDPQGKASDWQIFVGAAGRVRASRGRENVQEVRNSVCRHNRIFDRGNLQPHT